MKYMISAPDLTRADVSQNNKTIPESKCFLFSNISSATAIKCNHVPVSLPPRSFHYAQFFVQRTWNMQLHFWTFFNKFCILFINLPSGSKGDLQGTLQQGIPLINRGLSVYSNDGPLVNKVIHTLTQNYRKETSPKLYFFFLNPSPVVTSLHFTSLSLHSSVLVSVHHSQ